MIGWIVENASLFYTLLAIAALALVAGWWMTRRGHYLLGLIPVLLLGVGLWFLAAYAETDQKRIQRIVEEMAAGVRAGDKDKIIRHLSPSFTFRHMKLAEFRRFIEDRADGRHAADVQVFRFKFPKVSRAQGVAEVEFSASSDDIGGLPVRCEAEFVLDGDTWRMRRIEIFKGPTTEPLPIP